MTREPLPADLSKLPTEDVLGGLVERPGRGGEAWEVEEGELDGCHAIGDYETADGGPTDHGIGAAEGGKGEPLGLEGLCVRVVVGFSVRVVV